jgi:hypothetical protein
LKIVYLEIETGKRIWPLKEKEKWSDHISHTNQSTIWAGDLEKA